MTPKRKNLQEIQMAADEPPKPLSWVALRQMELRQNLRSLKDVLNDRTPEEHTRRL